MPKSKKERGSDKVASNPYGDLFDGLAARVDVAIKGMRAQHNFDKGPELEIAICEVLKSFLPERVAVARGFVVASDGTSAGDDIIVYDASRFPTLRGLGGDLSRKERVPAEAVLAYIEVKHTLHIGPETTRNAGQHLHKALSQIASVKRLARRPVPLAQIAPRFRLDGFGRTRRSGMPNVRNPWYGAIWALNMDIDDEPGPALAERVCELQRVDSVAPRHLPDVVAAGSVFGCPTIRWGQCPESSDPSDSTLVPRPFLARDTRMTITPTPHPIGIAMLHLSDAIDDLVLGGLSWTAIMRHQLARTETPPVGAVCFCAAEHAELDYPLPDGEFSPSPSTRPDEGQPASDVGLSHGESDP
ncbi:MAG: hypothetical protein JW940_12685 [Polyangiaceae bacterium]|nr:hypothetical protein [Polyangiaceae bacterium]